MRHDEERLRRFLVARDAGDRAGARALWEELVTDNFDRVRGMVAIESRSRLSPEERDDAVQLALTKLNFKMIHTFRGKSMGEWVASARTLVKFACMDTQRRAMAHSRHEVPLEDDERAAEPEEEPHHDGRAFLDWAIPQLPGRQREVIELDRRGYTVERMQTELEVSQDVIYQARKRGLDRLAKLRTEYRL